MDRYIIEKPNIKDGHTGSVSITDRERPNYPFSESIVFKFKIDQLPFCCGTYELGGFWSAYSVNNIPEELYKLLIPLIKECTDYTKTSISYPTTATICIFSMTNGQGPSRLMEQLFLETKTFKPTHTFTNRNTYREIKVWVSTNQIETIKPTNET